MLTLSWIGTINGTHNVILLFFLKFYISLCGHVSMCMVILVIPIDATSLALPYPKKKNIVSTNLIVRKCETYPLMTKVSRYFTN